MVEELMCVWCAFILLGGVESRIVEDYTKHVALFMVFLHFFSNKGQGGTPSGSIWTSKLLITT
jgi:hypothetical protein